jgi:hypothetical protein
MNQGPYPRLKEIYLERARRLRDRHLRGLAISLPIAILLSEASIEMLELE